MSSGFETIKMGNMAVVDAMEPVLGLQPVSAFAKTSVLGVTERQPVHDDRGGRANLVRSSARAGSPGVRSFTVRVRISP